jgi:hypothetical protein
VPIPSPRSRIPASPLRQVAPLAILTTASLVLAACSSSSSTTVDTHPPGVPYLTPSGVGDKTISSVKLPEKWSLVWKFSCANPRARRPFRVNVSSDSGPSNSITDQTGLEGGGYHPFTTGGITTFTVTTSCTWSLLVSTAGTQTFPTTTDKTTP